jgi:hypothetical protein
MRRALVVLAALAVGCGTPSGDAPAGAADAADDRRASDAGVVDGATGDARADAGFDATNDAGTLCPAGSALVADRRACAGAPLVVPAALAAAAGSASRGSVVSLGGLAEGGAPCMPAVVCAPADAPKMLFSDSPESPSADGVLYADTVPAGRYRIYVYHANGGNSPRKFSVVALNQGASAVTVTVQRRGSATPSKSYVQIGKAVIRAWLAPAQLPAVTVPPGARVVLDPQLDALTAARDELVHAIEDVTTSGALKISVVTVSPSTDAAAATAGLSLLPKDNHDRGTFANADLLLVPTAPVDAAGVRHLRLGANETEPDLTGVDATTGAAARLVGNYGVRYALALSGGARVAVGVAPRGSDWGGVARVSAGEDGAAGLVDLPASASSLGTTTDWISMGRFAAGATPIFELVTAGGSNLPIDVLFVPL